MTVCISKFTCVYDNAEVQIYLRYILLVSFFKKAFGLYGHLCKRACAQLILSNHT